MCILYAVNFPLSMAFTASPNLWQVVLSSVNLLKIFSNILNDFNVWTMHYVEMYFLIYKCVNFLVKILFISSLIPRWSENMFSIISVLWNLLRLALWFSIWSVLLNFPFTLEKFYFPLEFACSFLALSCGLFILVVISFTSFFERLNCEV